MSSALISLKKSALFLVIFIPTFTSSKNIFMSGQVADAFFCVKSSYFYFVSCFAILFYLGMYYVLTFCHSSVSTLRSTAINPSFGKNSLIRNGSNLKKLGTSKHLQCFL